MELRTLHTFVRIAEEKSFTRAATTLHYAQSTVTAQIKQLEEELGVRLFDRVGRQIYVTDAGHKLLAMAYDMLRRKFCCRCPASAAFFVATSSLLRMTLSCVMLRTKPK